MSDFADGPQRYCCAEQYMMYEKAILFGDIETGTHIMTAPNQKAMKDYGRQVKNFNEDVWNQKKFGIVLRGNILKFSQNRELRQYLSNTRDKILVEASPYDRIWGVGMQKGNADLLDPSKWKGQNLLGFALMEVRDLLREYDVFYTMLQLNRNNGIHLKDGIHNATRECERRGIITGNVPLSDRNQDDALEKAREESYMEGLAEGQVQERKEIFQTLLASLSFEQAARLLGISFSEARQLMQEE